MKLVWTCSYDGKKCEYENVNVKDGEIIQPEGVKPERGINAPYSWDKCVNCPHSFSLGISSPRLAIEQEDGKLVRV